MIDADTYIEKAVRAMLMAHVPLTNVVGENIEADRASDRSASSYVVFHAISATPVNVKQSISKVDTYRVQIDCYAQSSDLAKRLYRLSRQAIEQKQGTFGGMYIAQVKFEDYNGTFEEGSETYKSTADYMFRAHN